MAGDEIGVGLNVEIDNNLFKFLVSELKDDVKQILLKQKIDFYMDYQHDGGKDLQIPQGYIIIKDMEITRFEINRANELEI